jgi:hypothetical protein
MPVDDQNGEVMNGLLSYGGSLLIAMSHSLHNLYGWGSEDFTRRKEITGLGCIAPGSLTVGDGLIFFLSKEGVVWIRDGAAQNISEPIEPLLKQLTLEERAKVSAFSYDHKYYIAIPATTGDGGYSLLCEYDVQGSQSKGTPVWTVHTNLGGKAMTACDLDGDNGKLYALQPGTGDTSNLVEIFAPNTTTDDGEPIAAYAETRWLCDGQNSAWFDFRELFLEADFPTGGTMRIDWTVKQGSETKTGYFNVTKAGRVSLPVTAQGTDMKLKFSVNDALTWKLRGYTVVAVQRRVNR